MALAFTTVLEPSYGLYAEGIGDPRGRTAIVVSCAPCEGYFRATWPVLRSHCFMNDMLNAHSRHKRRRPTYQSKTIPPSTK